MWPFSIIASFFRDAPERYVLTEEGKREHCSDLTRPRVEEAISAQVVCQHRSAVQSKAGPAENSNTELRRSTRKRTFKQFYPDTLVERPIKRSRKKSQADRSYVDKPNLDESPAPSPNLPKPRKPVRDPTYRPQADDGELMSPISPIKKKSKKRRAPAAGAKVGGTRARKRKVNPPTNKMLIITSTKTNKVDMSEIDSSKVLLPRTKKSVTITVTVSPVPIASKPATMARSKRTVAFPGPSSQPILSAKS